MSRFIQAAMGYTTGQYRLGIVRRGAAEFDRPLARSHEGKIAQSRQAAILASEQYIFATECMLKGHLELDEVFHDRKHGAGELFGRLKDPRAKRIRTAFEDHFDFPFDTAILQMSKSALIEWRYCAVETGGGDLTTNFADALVLTSGILLHEDLSVVVQIPSDQQLHWSMIWVRPTVLTANQTYHTDTPTD